MGAKPLNYTTKIEAAVTVGEIMGLLSSHKAVAIGTQYEDGIPVALNFILPTDHGPRPFELTVPAGGMQRVLREAFPRGPQGGNEKQASREQAVRVAWRVVKDWLEAQLALVDAQIASLDQVMLPYLQVDGRSLYAAYRDQQTALEAGRG